MSSFPKLNGDAQLQEIKLLLEIVNPARGFITCVGYAKTQHRRCQVSGFGVRAPSDAQLRGLPGLIGDKVALESALRRIASDLLCPRWHRTGAQEDVVVREWFNIVPSMVAPLASATNINPQTPPRRPMLLSSTSSSPANPCAICREEIGTNGRRSTLPCGHSHCHDCIQTWRNESLRTDCPNCRDDPERRALERDRERQAEERRLERQTEAEQRRQEEQRLREQDQERAEEMATLLSGGDISEPEDSEDEEVVFSRPSTPCPATEVADTIGTPTIVESAVTSAAALTTASFRLSSHANNQLNVQILPNGHGEADTTDCIQALPEASYSSALEKQPTKHTESHAQSAARLQSKPLPISTEIVAAGLAASVTTVANVALSQPAPAVWADVKLEDQAQSKADSDTDTFSMGNSPSHPSRDTVAGIENISHAASVDPSLPDCPISSQPKQSGPNLLSSSKPAQRDELPALRSSRSDTMTYQLPEPEQSSTRKTSLNFFGLLTSSKYRRARSHDAEKMSTEDTEHATCLSCVDMRRWVEQRWCRVRSGY